MAVVCDYLNEDDGVLALCSPCAEKKGVLSFCIGVALGADQCENCGIEDDVEPVDCVKVERGLLMLAISELQEWALECGDIADSVYTEEEEESYTNKGSRVDKLIEDLEAILKKGA